MGIQILIAESRDILRTGLRAIFVADERIEQIYEVSNRNDLHNHLHAAPPLDLIIVNESLISDITMLPQERFIILAAELDIIVFQAAYKQRAKGYLLENSSAEILLTTLSLPNGAFLIEPTIVLDILDHFSCDKRFTIKQELLTPREKEITQLLRDGTDRRTIAKCLHISEATLKTHIKNITRKREQHTTLRQA